ncbi:MAG: malonyl CoA-acyl carrier protein transacylase [Gammaproteobacteria bacterium]|jgi:malonyl CoA-acyl carrier protein transacylase
MSNDEKKINEPIAIVGIGAIYPGNLGRDGFWRDIIANRDNISDVPPTHWLIEDYFDADPAAQDKTYCRRGGFISPIDFDPMEFAIPPTALPSTDTAQLLALVVAKQVLTEASRTISGEIDKSRTSVVLGVASATEMVVQLGARLQRPAWLKGLRESGVPEDEAQAICDRIASNFTPWQESSFPGMLGNVVAGRIANRLDLGGTNCVTDAACASSLSALQLAMNELHLGQSDLVISGGVDALNDILMFMCFSKTPAFSPTGDCRPFSDAADGTIIGEGIGMFALRRLADAERDGNAIYAIIKGIGSSSDGRSTSVYAPRPEGQALALRRAYDAAGYGPATIELLEAHGTATKAGDAAEFKALESVFGPQAEGRRQWCALGSVKSQIGHTKAAAGAAGLFKAVMALHHKVLPPTAKVSQPNPALNIAQSPFFINTKPRPWIRGADHPRRASVSSFGFGGSNFHVTVEEYTGPAARPLRTRVMPGELLVFSAAETKDLASRCRNAVNSCDDLVELAAIAQDSQRTFDAAAAYRLAIVARSKADLIEKLNAAAGALDDGETPLGADIAFGAGPADIGKVAFLFPGQGSQYVDMGADLAMAFDAARAVWDTAAGMETFAGAPLHRAVFPPPAFGDAERAEQQAALTAMAVAQPAIAAVSLSQLALVHSVGLRADAAAGHSFGEVTALYCAGVFDDDTVLSIARQRGLLMTQAAAGTDGAMSAVATDAATLAALVEKNQLDLVIANDNSPKQVILSGRVDEIERAESLLKAAALASRRLPVATAFHSPIVAASREPFADVLAQVAVGNPAFPVYANATAKPYARAAKGIRRQLTEQLASSVRFRETIERMYKDGFRLFVELGPGAVLTGLVGQCLDGRPHAAINLDRKGQNGLLGLWHGLGRLCALGVALDFAALWDSLPPATEERRLPAAHAVSITGANYAKPYPPAGGAAALPPPNPSAGGVAALPSSNPSAVGVTALPPSNPSAVGVTGLPPRNPAANLTPPTVVVAPNAPTPLSGVADERSLFALEEFQRHTAEAHAQFQQSMVETHQAFLRVTEQSLLAMSGDGVSELPEPRQRPVAVADWQSEPRQSMTPPPAFAVPSPVPTPVPASASTSVTRQHLPAPATAAPPAVIGLDLRTTLLEIVSEKTGYPIEMLDADMEMEAELGIDSIKQVEILSALRDRIPSLPEIEPARLAELKTLAQIIEFIGKSAAPSLSTSAASAAPLVTQVSAPNFESVLLDVVAEKTGYPVEMLELDMELEAGLGIDSIKQVEILSVLRDRVPGLPEPEPARLAELKTLTKILDYLDVAHASGGVELSSSAAVVATEQLSRAYFESVLLDVVAEKTGYPVEMLELDMELEAGLGIDSIKQVGILSVLRDRVPSLPEIEPARLAELKTLTKILDYLDTAHAEPAIVPSDLAAVIASPSAAMPVERQASEPATAINRLARYVPTLINVPATGFAMRGLLNARRVVVTPEAGKLGEALVEALREHGIAAERCSLPPADADAVICLEGLTKPAGPAASLRRHRDALRAARQVAGRFAQFGGVFVTVQDTGGDFGFASDPADGGWLGGFAGLVKTAALEWPQAAVKAIDIKRGRRTVAALATAIVGELLSGGPEIEVGLGAKGQRVTVSLRHSAQQDIDELPFDDGAVVVVSGGARGVTARAVERLAAGRRLRFVLLGRTPLETEHEACRTALTEAALKTALIEAARAEGRAPSLPDIARRASQVLAVREIRATLKTLSSLGAQTRYVCVDVSDLDAVAEAMAEVRRDWGGISVLIHGAGVLADKRIAQKTDGQFDRVFATKVDGLNALLQATRDDPLRAICLFSSAAARAGNSGQSDYAMANEVLNKVAQAESRRRGKDCVVKSINWGPWNGGMVTAALQAHFERAGVELIPVDAGADFLVRELAPGAKAADVEVLAGSALHAGTRLMRMAISIDGRGHPYLANHMIKGKAVLPAVLVIEWFMRAAQAVVPDMTPLALRDLHALKGIVLSRYPASECFEIQATLSTINGSTSIDMQLLSADGRTHYRACVEMGRCNGAAAPIPLPPATEISNDWPWTVDDIYGDKLFHGPDFQVIGGVGVVGGTISKKWPGGPWLTDPATLDGGMQLALLWGLRKADRVFLPVRIGAFIAHGPAPADGLLRCTFQSRLIDNLRTENDLTFVTLDGRVVAELKGIEMYPIDASKTANRDRMDLKDA